MSVGSNLCEEVVPQNVVQVGSVLWGLGEQAGDEQLGRRGQGGGQGVAAPPGCTGTSPSGWWSRRAAGPAAWCTWRGGGGGGETRFR